MTILRKILTAPFRVAFALLCEFLEAALGLLLFAFHLFSNKDRTGRWLG